MKKGKPPRDGESIHPWKEIKQGDTICFWGRLSPEAVNRLELDSSKTWFLFRINSKLRVVEKSKAPRFHVDSN